MFAILEEPLPWGISQPKADFRQSGEVRRIFACQPKDAMILGETARSVAHSSGDPNTTPSPQQEKSTNLNERGNLNSLKE